MRKRPSLSLRRRLCNGGAAAALWISALLCCALLLTAAALAVTVRYHAGLFLLMGAAGTLLPQIGSRQYNYSNLQKS